MPVDPTLTVELDLFTQGAHILIGVDEVGRGAMAGPVMVGVCALTAAVTEFPAGLRDSKLISEKKRLGLEPQLREWATVAVGEASPQEIDQWGISACLGLAGKRALANLHASGIDVGRATILLDGSFDWLNPALSSKLPVITRVKADQDCAIVSAASVIAKVTRDALMAELASAHPVYEWASNKGYGSANHMAAIAEHGVTSWHRVSWVKL